MGTLVSNGSSAMSLHFFKLVFSTKKYSIALPSRMLALPSRGAGHEFCLYALQNSIFLACTKQVVSQGSLFLLLFCCTPLLTLGVVGLYAVNAN